LFPKPLKLGILKTKEQVLLKPILRNEFCDDFIDIPAVSNGIDNDGFLGSSNLDCYGHYSGHYNLYQAD